MIRHKKHVAAILLLIILLGGVAVYAFRGQLERYLLRPTESNIPAGIQNGEGPDIQTVASNLDTPWGIAFLPNGDLLVTERPGTLKRIAEDNKTYPISGVTETSEGGLLGIALHPDFEDNNFLYLYSTYRADGQLRNRVERYTYKDDTLTTDKVVIENIPGSSNHDGGAIAFGPDDGKLYITTGDAGSAGSAQDTSVLSGKILRLNDDGTVPDDNPFSNPVYSYGHRNPQGLAWDDKGRLWSTEHGPSGSASGRDELNLIEKGANYGWPVITGDEASAGMRAPVAQSGDNDTWAPGALAYADGSLYFTGLRGQTLYQAVISDTQDVSVTLKRHFSREYGRLRAAAVRNGTLYISTSNTDGRGSPKPQDDKIIQIDLSLFR